jgi:RNA polymerase sigma-70 factor (ECF subfamily)
MNQTFVSPERPNGDAESDRQLLDAYCKSGDREAMNRLLLTHAESAYRLALRFSGNAADAEDIVQDAFLGCTLYASSYRPHGTVRSWILAIVSNAYRQRVNKERSRKQREQVVASDQALVSSGGPAESDLGGHLMRALEALPVDYRLPVAMRYLDELSFSDIAAALDIKEKSVRTRVGRGLERLRLALSKRGVAVTSAIIAASLTENFASAAPAHLGNLVQGVVTNASSTAGIMGKTVGSSVALKTGLITAKVTMAGLALTVMTFAAVYIVRYQSGHSPSNHVTEFYVDPDYRGAVQTGKGVAPWTIYDSSSPMWPTVNNALASGDVTIYFSARQADSDLNQQAKQELKIMRTNASTYRLTLDGMSQYNASDALPSWSSYSGLRKFEISTDYPIIAKDTSGPVNYVTIRGFRILSVSGQLLSYSGGSHVIIENNELSALPGSYIGNGLSFGDIPGTVDVTIRNNVIHDTFGSAVAIGNHSYSAGSPTSLVGVMIMNNHIYNVGKHGGEGDCVDIAAGIDNVVVSKNICHDNQGGNANGIVSLSPFTAEGNIVYNVLGNCVSLTAGTNVIRGNTVFKSRHGIYAADLATIPVDVTLLNNTIYDCSDAGIIIGAESSASVFRVKNNIVMNCSSGLTGWGKVMATITNNDIYANDIDYNYPFRPEDGQNIADRNISTDPLFVNVENPAGHDGIFFTPDDGFSVRDDSPVAAAGEGGSPIGAR